ncbi:unnamed protein product [Haemonchus placei]|uniref:Protein zwilch n=1 Tax=Haemonchus placei TaxID=6290 RepID=A0A158QNH4_HAEPC|nr:unnamed protein product [Haemonchus placei]
MTEVIGREQVKAQPSTFAENSRDSLLFGKFRIRLCKSEEVPILADLYGNRYPEIVVVDLPSEAKQETRNAETVGEVHKRLDNGMDTDADEMGDGPLVFDFLSLSKLERRCGTDEKGERSTANRPIVSTNYFDCNPLDAPTAFGLRNRFLRKNCSSGLNEQFAGMPVWIIVNAKDQLGTAFVGHQLSNTKISTFHTRCLGRFGEKCERAIKVLANRFKHGLDAKDKALALYSILGNNVSPTWGPKRCLADMTLTFKWDTKTESFLCSPPPSASAIFHFSPGWKDKRVALLEATEHLEHVDFTELLWDILKKCPDYKTLVAALNIVFDALKQCRINAVLHEDNKSSIARLIRDAQSQDLMLPRLEALTPIQILLEIGYERFKRDMVQAYNSAGFTTNETDLDLDLKPQPNVSLEERTRALLPLHLALQTLLEMKRYLILPDHTLNTLTRSVIAKYSAGPITDITKVFYEKAVSLIHVQQGLIEKLPDLWTHETSYSSGGSLVAQAFVHLTREPRLHFLEDKTDFEPVINEPDQVANDKRFLSAVMAMIFRRKEVKKAFEVFTDRALKYVFRIPRCVTLPEHEETHELIHTMDSNTMSVDELNRNCERLAAEVVEKRFTLLDLEQQLQEANDVIEVLSIVIKQLQQTPVGEDCNDGTSSNTTLGGTDTN